jgi:hypothetical protein
MDKNKGDAGNIAGFIDLDNELTMKNLTTTQYRFQYHCSFCACELPADGLRFNGVGACPACDELARLWVNSLREHTANYFSNSEVK